MIARGCATRLLARELPIWARADGSVAEQTSLPGMHQHGSEIPRRDARLAGDGLGREQPSPGAFVLHHGLLLALGDRHDEKAHAVEARWRKRQLDDHLAEGRDVGWGEFELLDELAAHRRGRGLAGVDR